jgi:limonene-1,2-epoxide hydrolase
MAPEQTSPEATVDAFIERVVAKDLEGACELVAADMEYDNVPMGKNYGPDGIKAVLGAMVDGVGQVEFVVHRQVVVGNLVVNERTDRFEVNGTWIDLPVAGFFEVNADGLITLWRDYFDVPTLMDQMAKVVAG